MENRNGCETDTARDRRRTHQRRAWRDRRPNHATHRRACRRAQRPHTRRAGDVYRRLL